MALLDVALAALLICAPLLALLIHILSCLESLPNSFEACAMAMPTYWFCPPEPPLDPPLEPPPLNIFNACIAAALPMLPLVAACPLPPPLPPPP